MQRFVALLSILILIPIWGGPANATENNPAQQKFFAPDGIGRQRTLIGREFLKRPPGEQFSFVAGVLDGLAWSGDDTVLKCLSNENVPTDPVSVALKVKAMLQGNGSWQDSPVVVYVAGVFKMACKGQ